MTAADRPVRLAIIGAGLIGRRHIELVLNEDRAALMAIVRNLCGVIRGTTQPVVSEREGLGTPKVVAAVKESAATGGVIDVV
jgi:hypothetical protein